MTELVARETDDIEALGGILLIKCFQPVILRGKTTLGGRIYNEKDIALILGKVQLFAAVGLGGEIVDRRFVAGAGNGANGSQDGKYLFHGSEGTDNPSIRQNRVQLFQRSSRFLQCALCQTHGQDGHGNGQDQNGNQYRNVIDDRNHLLVVSGGHLCYSCGQGGFGVEPPV